MMWRRKESEGESNVEGRGESGEAFIATVILVLEYNVCIS